MCEKCRHGVKFKHKYHLTLFENRTHHFSTPITFYQNTLLRILSSLFQAYSSRLSKMRSIILILLVGGTGVLAQTQYTSTASSAVAKARATALTESPTSNLVGKSFNRFVSIWCENTDYSMAAADGSLPPFLYLACLWKKKMFLSYLFPK